MSDSLNAVSDITLPVYAENDVQKTEKRRKSIFDRFKRKNEDEKPGLSNSEVTRGFVISTLSSLYCLLLISLGIVFPVAIFISGNNFNKQGVYLSVYRFYMYTVGIAIYGYILFNIHRFKQRQRKKKIVKEKSDKTHKISKREVYVINEDVSDEDETYESFSIEDEEEVPDVYETYEGINFFLRCGLVAFGLASLMLLGIRVVEFIQYHVIRDCYGIGYETASVFGFIHILVQTSFLFKFHKTGFNCHKPMVRFGIFHNIAVNISNWSGIIVIETVEAYNHYVHESEEGHVSSYNDVSPTHIPTPTTTILTPSSSKPQHHGGEHESEADEYLSAALCLAFPNTLGTAASPYLFPFFIEYSLLAAAFLLRMLGNIGTEKYHEAQHEKMLQIQDRERFPDLYFNQPSATQCTRSNRGLFVGLVVVIVIGIGICFFLFLGTADGGAPLTRGLIYVVSDLSLEVLTTIILVPAFWQLRRLHFSLKLGNLLDQRLLVFALFVTYIIDGFVVVAALSGIGDADSYFKLGSQMIAAASIFQFFQVTFLVGFIIDGLQRRSVTAQQVKQKPGRTLVALLLLLNIAVWLILTFEMKLVNNFTIFTDFYGKLGWTIILSVLSPVAIYFRFHCAVCLSDMWINSYEKSPIDVTTEDDLDKYGKLL